MKFELGRYNVLPVKNLSKTGCYLDGGSCDIYLPKKDMPKVTRPGDALRVFIYNDSKDSLKATSMTPKAIVGDFAALMVKSVTNFGAFLDWGIDKDLFVPHKYQRISLQEGDITVVYLILDYEKTGVIGTCQLESYFEKDISDLQVEQKVELLVLNFLNIGVGVIIDNKYSGLLYKNEVYEKLNVGDSRTGYIKKLRSDGRLDVSLRRQGFKPASEDAKAIILKALKESNGFLPLHDRSSPSHINRRLKLNKKIFKKTIGGLYKERIISIEKTGIRLLSR